MTANGATARTAPAGVAEEIRRDKEKRAVGMAQGKCLGLGPNRGRPRTCERQKGGMGNWTAVKSG